MRTDVRRVAVVGAGVIGNAWAAHLLAHGLEVAVTDPNPQAEDRLLRDVERALPVLARLGVDAEGWQKRLVFTDELEKALDGADFVQENGPERVDVKVELFAELDRVAPPDVVIASSSSSMLPSRLAGMCARHPERVVVGHPFNPVYLIPLVEVVGHAQTPAEVVDAAMAFYASVGKRPVHVRREVPGHLAEPAPGRALARGLLAGRARRRDRRRPRRGDLERPGAALGTARPGRQPTPLGWRRWPLPRARAPRTSHAGSSWTTSAPRS